MKALFGVVMMCVAGGVAAQEETKLVRCTSYAELAQTVMGARQAGVPLAKLLETSTNVEAFSGLFMMAYEYPAYHSPEMQEKTISDFYASEFIACMKEIK